MLGLPVMLVFGVLAVRNSHKAGYWLIIFMSISAAAAAFNDSAVTINLIDQARECGEIK